MSFRHSFLALAVCVATALPGVAQSGDGAAQPAARAKARAEKPIPTLADVHYGPHERNTFDLWKAPSETPTPLLVYIHGGGFVQGSKSSADGASIRAALGAGVSFMAINYRFRPEAAVQDILRDCARSIQFVRAHAKEYNIDPKRIASYGSSGGAGASLWLAFHPDLADPKDADPVLRESSRLVAAAALNTQATYDLLAWSDFLPGPGDRWARPGEVASFYGFISDSDLQSDAGRAIRADVDMLGLITRDDPPVFLSTSSPDTVPANRGEYLHHPAHARAVKKRCDDVGVQAVLVLERAEPRPATDPRLELRKFLFGALRGTP